MAVLESLLAAVASKSGAIIAGTALALGGVGTAAAAGNLPSGIQAHVDALLSTERGAPETVEVVEVEEDLAEERSAEADEDAGDAGKGEAVSNAARTAGEGLEGRERGQAISEAVRAANGSLDKGQGAERRAEAAERAEARGGNADAAEERRAEAASRAEAGRANADADTDATDEEDDASEVGPPAEAGPPADAGAAGDHASQRRATPGADR